MRVLHTIWSASFGGIERLALDLGTAQERLGMEVGLFVCVASGEYLTAFQSSPIVLHEGSLRHGADLRPSVVRGTASLMRQYDIVHQHAFTPAVATASIISRSPVVYTEHGNFGFGRKPTHSDYVLAKLRKAFLNRHVRHITFNSAFTRSVAKTRYGLERTAHSVVYNGVSFSAADDEQNSSADSLADQLAGRFVVGTTSRFAGFKRIDRLIRAFAKFRVNKPTTLLLVGDGPFRTDYVALVDQLGLREDVIFTGFQQNVSALQRQMDICVFPSETEPFGLVAVETLSLGKPTIVLDDGGGITEIVRRHDTADVVSGINGLVLRLNHYYQRRHQLGADSEARISAARFFDIRRMANEMCRIYESVLRNTPATQQIKTPWLAGASPSRTEPSYDYAE